MQWKEKERKSLSEGCCSDKTGGEEPSPDVNRGKYDRGNQKSNIRSWNVLSWFRSDRKKLDSSTRILSTSSSNSSKLNMNIDETKETLNITIYQYSICPFCNKVKAVLDLFKHPYSVIEVNPISKKEIKQDITEKFKSDYKKVPQCIIDQDLALDSPVIVRTLIDKMKERELLSKAQIEQFMTPNAIKWSTWADEKLAVLLFPNITRSFEESFQAFSYVQDVKSFGFIDKMSNQWVGALAMWLAQGKIKKK